MNSAWARIRFQVGEETLSEAKNHMKAIVLNRTRCRTRHPKGGGGILDPAYDVFTPLWAQRRCEQIHNTNSQ